MIDIAIDIGGTFTDVACLENGSRLFCCKIPSTPKNPVIAVRKGINKILQSTEGNFADIRQILHGTTVATNAVIERKGAKLGILTTKGFEDVLEIGRQQRSSLYDLSIDVQTPVFLAPRRMRVGITERIGPNGEVITELNENEVVNAVKALKNKYAVESLAVCYLFSFVNPAHELRTRKLVKKHFPDIEISLSSELSPMFREYERLCVTAFDAYVRNIVSRYIMRLEENLNEEEDNKNIKTYIMKSSGGLNTSRAVAQRPVNILLSGPSGGVLGGKYAGELAKFKNIISIDMGGTSFDVALVKDGNLIISREGKICDFPLRVPMIDLNTIGAGGGSIAWVDSVGGLHVGPQSAGSEPGPACYGVGGEEATSTDASLVLGYINPDYFAGGDFRLYADKATRAIDKIAKKLKMEVASTAFGIHRILNSRMADEIRLVSIRRGYDPREFAIVALGGAGPVHAGALAKMQEIPKVIVPERPGVQSAFGLHLADVEYEQAMTLIMRLDELDFKKLNQLLVDLDKSAEAEMKKDDISFNRVKISRFADLRYLGQSFELEVPIPEKMDEHNIGQVEAEFAKINERIYGHVKSGVPIEFTNFRTVYAYDMPKPQRSSGGKSTSDHKGAKNTRNAYFNDRYVSTPIYERIDLPIGFAMDGPAIVEQSDTTTVIYPGQKFSVDQFDNIIIEAIGG